ncbi:MULTISPECIES: ABC transporter ATP-binding protein [Pelosinus]|uniref:ABC transporter related protein n=1 Tax=Pelosinus fermentans B4 TaxID=1149862 RepID=I8R9V7_9FIRM|nr:MULTISPECIES: ABC transporter ATP-binding protein [Pelosinus]EIW15603.1 ABC transporter related protein [Pelosinus fermentans B4]EIW26707.1 ABC transporter related protein [Pelosinus fermentans A11]OAM92348.1 Taurine-transporting ATPase [Pelosinus fermentans DSM 17108]SDQ41690.1 NitT/TauT family transport system ATP-binding protein [Pelosinus fermentans]
MSKIQASKIHRQFQVNNDFGKKTKLTVLDDFNLQVREGEFLSILGPSGCGKSTFLNMLAGLDKQDGGQILIDSEPVSDRSFDRGMVFQGYALFPWRTVLENVEIGLQIRGLEKKEREEIARYYLAMVGLTAFANRYPHQLSGGMKQRVAIARVLAYQPDIMLMDEPFAALDAQTRETLQLELIRIWEADKKTIVFITHSIDEAILLSDRVAVMTARPGKVKEIIDVSLPRPRSEEIRNSSEFAQIRQYAWSLIKDEVTKAQGLQESIENDPGRIMVQPIISLQQKFKDMIQKRIGGHNEKIG